MVSSRLSLLVPLDVIGSICSARVVICDPCSRHFTGSSPVHRPHLYLMEYVIGSGGGRAKAGRLVRGSQICAVLWPSKRLKDKLGDAIHEVRRLVRHSRPQSFSLYTPDLEVGSRATASSMMMRCWWSSSHCYMTPTMPIRFSLHR